MIKRLWLIPVCLLVSLAPARSAVERTIERHFPASPGSTLKIDTYHGPIRVESTDDQQIHVIIHETIDAENGAAADRRAAELELGFVQVGDDLTIVARHRRYLRWAWENWPPVALSFEVKVPYACNVELVSREGSIVVGNLKGAVRVRTLSGAVFIGEIDGPVSATSAQGDLAVTACTGPLTLLAESGSVLVGRASGVTKIDGTNGAIEVQRARDRLEIEGNNADVKASFVHPIVVDSKLHSSGGDVIVSFDQRSACTVTARASRFGEVKVKSLSFEVVSGDADGGSRLVGKLNGGGPAIVATASGGNVRLNGYGPH